MLLIYFVFGLANVLAIHNNYEINIQDSKFDISEENVPIEEPFNNRNIENDLKREKRYARNNVFYKKNNNTITSFNNTPRYNYTNNNLQHRNFITQNNGNRTNGYNNWMNNNVTRNNGFTNWNNIARRNYNNGTNIPGGDGNRYPGYNPPTYGATTNGYNNGNRIQSSTPQFSYHPAQINYNGNASRPGYGGGFRLNNTKPGYAPTPYPAGYPKPGNNTGFNGFPPGYMPYPGNNTRYFTPNNTATSFNYKPVPNTPGYMPKPGTGSSVPIFNMTGGYNYGNSTFSNGSSAIDCNRCSKKDIAMNACAILCNDCPDGMIKVGGVCVSVSRDPDEDY